MPSTQYFKAIYFPDYKSFSQRAKGFVLAFGERNQDLYKTIAPLSSHEVRELLGTNSFIDLERSATKEGLAMNTYCVWRLKKAIEESTNSLFPSSALVDRTKQEIKPIHATFRGGRKNPLHNWYSFLEGYSPEYVEYILDNYAPNANTVYDPFAGTGVTPLVAAKRGLNALYSEINPLLQFLVKTKVDASALAGKVRARLIESLYGIKKNLSILIDSKELDQELHKAHKETFGKSVFFDKETLDLVLKARTLIDELSYSNQLIADIVLVAMLNSLIPASLLQRAGDLRYKTKDELKKKTDFVFTVQQNLANIIQDLGAIEPLPATPILVAENTKLIEKFLPLNVDAIITSPPYLNGTNYFRNTKVELWFLRSIKTPDDLSGFRRATVTAGINDVSLKKPSEFTTENVQKVVDELKDKAYDQRIPKMVTDYFQDIAKTFTGLKKHLKHNAVIAIDIGDSVYSGVKVPTDALFVEVLQSLGYRFQESITLRKRLSRNGEILKQALLLFKAPTERKENAVRKSPWMNAWKIFKKEMPHRVEPYSKRNWGHPLHSLCSYQGKMKPSLAYYLVKTFTKTGDKMLDPFAGVGTIPFEAALNGVHAFGFEISSAALSIAKAKLGRIDKSEPFSVIKKLESYLESTKLSKNLSEKAEEFGMNKKLKDYYEPKTLQEIIKAREFFKKTPAVTTAENLVFASLLHILHGNRPYALSRRSHGITPFAPTGNFEYKPLIKHLSEKVARSLSVELPRDFVNGDMLYQDATSWWPRHIDNLDAVITSPPFFDSTRFYLANWLRLWFSGWEPTDFRNKPLGFVDERQKNSFLVYEPVLRQSRERLKSGGVLVFHLGKSKKCDMAERLSQLAKQWFRVVDVFEEDVEDTESHGIRDKGTVVRHQFLVLS